MFIAHRPVLWDTGRPLQGGTALSPHTYGATAATVFAFISAAGGATNLAWPAGLIAVGLVVCTPKKHER